MLPGALTPPLCNIVLFVVLTETQRLAVCTAPGVKKQSSLAFVDAGVYDHGINTKHSEVVDVSW